MFVNAFFVTSSTPTAVYLGISFLGPSTSTLTTARSRVTWLLLNSFLFVAEHNISL